MATIKTQMTIVGSNTELPIECHADFSKVPPHLQDSYARAFLYAFNKGFDIYSSIPQEESKMSKQAEKPKKKLLFLQNIKSWLTKN